MNHITPFNIVLLCLVAIVCKIMVLGGNLAESGVVLSLCLYLLGQAYLDIKKNDLLREVNEQIVKMSTEFQKIYGELNTLKTRLSLESSTRKLTGVEKTEQKPKRFF